MNHGLAGASPVDHPLGLRLASPALRSRRACEAGCRSETLRSRRARSSRLSNTRPRSRSGATQGTPVRLRPASPAFQPLSLPGDYEETGLPRRSLRGVAARAATHAVPAARSVQVTAKAGSREDSVPPAWGAGAARCKSAEPDHEDTRTTKARRARFDCENRFAASALIVDVCLARGVRPSARRLSSRRSAEDRLGDIEETEVQLLS